MQLPGKVAVVTGGASGLGKATAERYVSEGACVAIFDLNDDAGEAAARKLGEQAAYYHVDVADESSVQQALDSVTARFGAVHVLNNFAGIGTPGKTLGKRGPHPLDQYLKVVQVNQVGTFNVARLAAEKMAQHEPVTADGIRGVIINTASVAAFEGQVGQVAYSATKGAIVGMTLPMARELAEFGIRVNTLAPGLIHTPMFDAVEESFYNSLKNSVVFPKRLGTPEEIAALCVSIVENDYINGETIRIDGAIRMQPR